MVSDMGLRPALLHAVLLRLASAVRVVPFRCAAPTAGPNARDSNEEVTLEVLTSDNENGVIRPGSRPEMGCAKILHARARPDRCCEHAFGTPSEEHLFGHSFKTGICHMPPLYTSFFSAFFLRVYALFLVSLFR